MMSRCELTTQYDSAKSFYGKAYVEDTKDGMILVSYSTHVATIQDGKAYVHNTQSQTTLRHIKEFLKQQGFKAETKAQILKDYGEEEV